MAQFTTRSYFSLKPRLWILGFLFILVVAAQCIPSWGEFYARNLYPYIGAGLSACSSVFPFAVGDVFVCILIISIVAFPIWAHVRTKRRWTVILFVFVEWLLWLYVWFYIAWGLNYSQKDFYERTGISRVEYSPARFASFANNYIAKLNANYMDVAYIDDKLLYNETIGNYDLISEKWGVNRPLTDLWSNDNRGVAEHWTGARRNFYCRPRVKTMLFSSLASKVGVTGSMQPFFCEFTLNADLPTYQYPATYAHEFAHLLGITNEAEANFYAYQVCTRSTVKEIRFSGYFFLLPHVLNNARSLMSEGEYNALVGRIRPEVIALMKQNRDYWHEKYSPTLGKWQDKVYDWYLKRNKIESGRQNYSEVIGLLISVDAPLNPPKGGTSQQ